MHARSGSIALTIATLLAASCARERSASSGGAKGDTTSRATRSAPASSSLVVPPTPAQCGLPQPLQCADRAYLAFFQQTAAPLVPAYRLPGAEDFKDYWKSFGSFIYQTRDDTDSTKAPYWTKGDFNNDGIPDFAYILIRRNDRSKALFAFLSGGDGYSVVSLAEGFNEEMGLATQHGGSFTTAAGKGYSQATPEQPAVVHVDKLGIAFFMFEGAGSLFVWDARTQRLVRVWMSD